MSYFCTPPKCLWTQESSLNGPLQSVSIHTRAGGYLWPFASQHLSSTVSFSSLSFLCLSISLWLCSADPLPVYFIIPCHVHYFQCSCFFTQIHTAACSYTQMSVPLCVHIRTYTRAYTAWHTSLLSRCAELRRMAAIKLELMNSMGARGRQRERCEKWRLDQFYRPFVIPTGSMDTQRGL